MKKELTIAFLAVGLTIGMASLATAQTLEQETDVEVEISGVTQLDVRPSSLSYTSSGDEGALEPGDDRTVSDLGFEHIEVENIGSERIGNIYAQATMHNQQPFGTDTDDDTSLTHNTGNFVTVSLDTAQDYGFDGELSDVDTMHHLNRVEYFEENPPTYIQTIEPNDGNELQDPSEQSELTSEVTEVDVGRFRVGGAEYFFVIYNSEYMFIGDSPHTSTVLGTTDFTNDGSDGYSYEELDDTSEGVTDVARIGEQDFVTFDTESSNYTGQALISGGNEEFEGGNIGSGDDEISAEDINAEFREYALFVDTANDFVVRTRFNVQQSSPDENDTYELSDDDGQEYILNAGNIGETLQPGDNFPINFGVQVPQGVDQTAIEEGTVTVISETFS